MTRRLIGNLFAESVWARMAAATRRADGRPTPSPLDPRYMPSDDVMHRLAPLATLLRAFAEEGDLLWTPRPVAPERMPDVPGVARPLLVTGTRPTPAPGDVAWADATEAAVAANDRRLALELQRALGCALPGAAVAETIGAAADAVREAAAATAGGMWIVKAVHSSAGRGRVGARGPDLAAPHRAGVEKLLELHGAVVVEPWVPRLADFGATATAAPPAPAGAEASDVAFHDLENLTRGDFRGIAFPVASLRPDETSALRTAVGAAARALAGKGYAGPFGVDAFRWRDASGAERFHALCEINARCTFGRVARAFAARIGPAAGVAPTARWSFRVGGAEELASAPRDGAFFVLLSPAPPDDVAAWIRAV